MQRLAEKLGDSQSSVRTFLRIAVLALRASRNSNFPEDGHYALKMHREAVAITKPWLMRVEEELSRHDVLHGVASPGRVRAPGEDFKRGVLPFLKELAAMASRSSRGSKRESPWRLNMLREMHQVMTIAVQSAEAEIRRLERLTEGERTPRRRHTLAKDERESVRGLSNRRDQEPSQSSRNHTGRTKRRDSRSTFRTAKDDDYLRGYSPTPATSDRRSTASSMRPTARENLPQATPYAGGQYPPYPQSNAPDMYPEPRAGQQSSAETPGATAPASSPYDYPAYAPMPRAPSRGTSQASGMPAPYDGPANARMPPAPTAAAGADDTSQYSRRTRAPTIASTTSSRPTINLPPAPNDNAEARAEGYGRNHSARQSTSAGGRSRSSGKSRTTNCSSGHTASRPSDAASGDTSRRSRRSGSRVETDSAFSEINMGYQRPQRRRKCHHDDDSDKPSYCDSLESSQPDDD